MCLSDTASPPYFHCARYTPSVSLFHRSITHTSNDMFLENEVNNRNGNDSYDVRGKTWAIVIKVLSAVIVLEKRERPHT